jgi:hypothetical protein
MGWDEYVADHARRMAEAAERFVTVEADYRVLVGGASGLRGAFLVMHGPQLMGDLVCCTHCEAYNGGLMPWPCENHELARDWKGES